MASFINGRFVIDTNIIGINHINCITYNAFDYIMNEINNSIISCIIARDNDIIPYDSRILSFTEKCEIKLELRLCGIKKKIFEDFINNSNEFQLSKFCIYLTTAKIKTILQVLDKHNITYGKHAIMALGNKTVNKFIKKTLKLVKQIEIDAIKKTMNKSIIPNDVVDKVMTML